LTEKQQKVNADVLHVWATLYITEVNLAILLSYLTQMENGDTNYRDKFDGFKKLTRYKYCNDGNAK